MVAARRPTLGTPGLPIMEAPVATDDKTGHSEKLTIRPAKGKVDGLELPPSGGRSMAWDTELKGFGVRVAASGKKTCILRYRMGGRDTPVRTVTIGQYGSPWTTDQARRHAAEFLTQIRQGGDVVGAFGPGTAVCERVWGAAATDEFNSVGARYAQMTSKRRPG